MAVKPFAKEELNFFKFASIVLGEFPKMLRETFVKMWNNKIATLPGGQVWDDSLTVRNFLLAQEGGRTEIPTSLSINEWDCTALFKATIFSKTFGRTTGTSKLSKTLSQQYLTGKKPNPFHLSVTSLSGDHDETLTLAIDQVRLLRNTLCHNKPRISKPDFDHYVQLAKDAFAAAGVPTARIDEISCLGEEDFPTEKVNKLSEDIQRMKSELEENNMYLLEVLKKDISALNLGQENLLNDTCRIRDGQNTILKETSDLRDGQSKLDETLKEFKDDTKNRGCAEGPVKLMQPNEPKVTIQEFESAPLTGPEIARIAFRIPDKWDKVALATGKFKQCEIVNIRLNVNLHDNVSKAIEMLHLYQRRRGTRKALASALKEFGDLDLAEKVQSRYFQTHTNDESNS